MTENGNAPALAGDAGREDYDSRRHCSTQKPELKWRRTLRELLARSASDDPRRWLNRFVAERTCSDHTLPSTISELERAKGLRFDRREIEVVGYGGGLARLTAYRIAPEFEARARELLGGAP